jgi:hypothetical protein
VYVYFATERPPLQLDDDAQAIDAFAAASTAWRHQDPNGRTVFKAGKVAALVVGTMSENDADRRVFIWLAESPQALEFPLHSADFEGPSVLDTQKLDRPDLMFANYLARPDEAAAVFVYRRGGYQLALDLRHAVGVRYCRPVY